VPTFHRGFLVLDASGNSQGVTSDPEEAGHMAESVAGTHKAALWLATLMPEYVSARPNRMTGEASVAHAVKRSGLPHLRLQDILAVPDAEVRAAVNEMRVLEGREPMKTGGLYSVARGLVQGNTKMDKVAFFANGKKQEIKGASKGVSLAPHALSFLEAKKNWKAQRAAVLNAEYEGDTFCARSVPSCRAACLVGTGLNAGLSTGEAGKPRNEGTAYRAKIWRSVMLRRYPAAFLKLVVQGFDIWRKEAATLGIVPFGRLNALSDLPWEAICPDLVRYLSEPLGELPAVNLYDYTKVPGRTPEQQGLNYHLTFSWSGPSVYDEVVEEMDRGRNVAVAFFHPSNRAATGKQPARVVWPDGFLGAPVISGDDHDLRPLDRYHPKASGGPVIVGLRFKPPWTLDTAGAQKRSREQFGAFVVDVYETQDDAGKTIYVGCQEPSYTKHGKTWILEDLPTVESKRQAFESKVAAAKKQPKVSR
jgi:hypothetical protein